MEHSLQAATRAYHDKRDNEYVICTLLHDVGEVIDPYRRDGIIAELLKDYISEKNYFTLKHHTKFQRFYYWTKLGFDLNDREQHRNEPYYDDALEFIEQYDDKSFDKNYISLSIDDFTPMLVAFFQNRK